MNKLTANKFERSNVNVCFSTYILDSCDKKVGSILGQTYLVRNRATLMPHIISVKSQMWISLSDKISRNMHWKKQNY